MSSRGKLFVVSGPSGSGKTTLTAEILKSRELKNRATKSVSFTTRPKRLGEKHKKDYFFVSEKVFKTKLLEKKILEWTKYLGYYYGTSKEFIDAALLSGKNVVLCVDLKGAFALKKLYRNNAVLIFILPPSINELRERLECRCRETNKKEITRRINLAKKEILCSEEFDYKIINKDFKQTVCNLKKIILEKITD